MRMVYAPTCASAQLEVSSFRLGLGIQTRARRDKESRTQQRGQHFTGRGDTA